MKTILYLILFLISTLGFSQDISMEDGTFNRCAPDKFYDSGGEFGPYSNDENYTTTICPQNADEFIILNFTEFNTQLNQDVMTIYDGDDTTAAIIGTYTATTSPGTVSASASNTSGCLTITFTSNGSGVVTGWEAEILCAVPCQNIVASIDNTVPAPNGSGVVSILPGDSVDFNASATFSVDGANATYSWDFGDTNTAVGADVTNTFTSPGTYVVTLTVTDDNPQVCSDTETITVFVLGPNVVIDQDTYTPIQLIEDVLINSPCASVTNITSSTGTDFSATQPNGIGYFISNGIDFPFADGVLLASGDASEARGPNNINLSQGSSGTWPGDTDLNTEFGIGTTNATFIQFDFTPLGNNISFEFLMASEEYNGGSFECTYSDAFAFFLTDSNGVTTNLAVLPGTTTPISVTNIHLENSNCLAENPQYFGGYTATNASPIAFDGRTTIFTAQSAVNPGEQYTIKLVIGDDGNNNGDAALDSGVFLKAGSFNLGGDLGGDRTIDIGNAPCAGGVFTLNSGVDIPSAIHTWYFNGAVITGETGSVINVTEPGVYFAEFDIDGVCQGSAEPVTIEFKPSPTANNAPNLSICSVTGFGEFNLSENDDDILGTQDPADFVISYYLNEQDAIDNVGALPSNYTNVSNPQTIWSRIADNSQECYSTISFELNGSSQPTINSVDNLELCDDVSNDGFETFDLSTQTAGILGGQAATDFNVTYYTSFADADAATGALPLSYTNTVNSEPIYIRVESLLNPDCYNVSAMPVFNLVVNTRAIANTPDDMVVCDDASNDGFSTFNLSTQETDILGAQDSTIYMVSFHNSQTDAEANASPLPTNYTNVVPNLETVFVRIEDPTYPDCYGTTSFDLIVNSLPNISVPSPLQVCDDVITDGFTSFPLTNKNDEILNGQTGIDVTYYESLAAANAGTPTITDGYINTTMTNQIIFVRLENTTTNCYNTTTLALGVLDNPIANATTALEVCDDDNDGFSLFNLSTKDAEVIGIQTGMSVSYYDTFAEAEIGNTPLTLPYANISANTQEIYARIENDNTGCYAVTSLQLIVNPLPTTIAVIDYELCDYDTTVDEQEAFDLTTKDTEITNGQANIAVTYYANQADADAGANALTSPYSNTSNPQTIVAVLTNTLSSCSSSTTFNLVVNPLPAIVAPTALEVCDDGTPDGFTAIDLTLKNTEISGNNPLYSVSYYLTQTDANNEVNPLPNPYTNTSNSQIVFVRVEDTGTGCYNTTPLELIVQQAPVANIPDALRYCDPDNDGFGLFMLTDADTEITGGATGLSVSYHETQTNAENNVDAIDTTIDYNNIVVNTQTVYARVESATIATDCASIVPLQLIVEPTPQLVAPTPLEVCDDASADGFAQFDLTSKAAEILGSQDPVQYIVSYYESEANAQAANNPIANPNGYTNLTAFTQTLWVRVDDTTTIEGCYKVTTLALIVNPLPVLVQPTALVLCDALTLNDGQEAFDLTTKDAEILNGQTDISITYYATQLDADNGSNPITSPYTNISNPQTIYVRAVDDTTSCYNTITLTLRVNPLPSPEATPAPIEVCDDDNDGFAQFDLEQRTVAITNGELDVQITYHETQQDAESGANPIIGLYTNVVPNNQDIYVRSEHTITGCYSITENALELIVLASPEVSTTIIDYVICDTNNDGFSQFDLTTKATAILNGQDPTQHTITYHISEVDAASGSNAIANPGNYTNTTNPQTIYVHLESTVNGCTDTGMFEIRVDLPPEAVQPTPLEACDDLDEAGDEITVFNLTVKDAEITAGNASWSVAYYETQADADAEMNAIPDATAYTNTSVSTLPANPQTLYVVVTDTDTGCTDSVTLTLRVLPNPTPTASDQIPTLELCDDINTGDGVELFDLTENEVLLLNGEAGVTPTYYNNSDDAYAGTNAIADPTQYSNTSSPDEEIIYVRVTSDTTGCYAVVNFTIKVNALPAVVAVSDFIQCELNTDGFAEFDLITKDAEILNGQDPLQFVVTYHETVADAQASINPLVSPYTNITNPQQIFVNITNTVTGCDIATQSFIIGVHEDAQANSDTEDITYEECDDTMETDGDTTNDSTQFNLSIVADVADLDPESTQAQVLDGQDPANYIVSYYATEADANLEQNVLPNLYENVVNPQVIYARVDNNTLGVTAIDLDLTQLTAGLNLDASVDGSIDTYDTDADGIFDLVDINADGISDVLQTNTSGTIRSIDTNADGIADFIDLDNDGVFDNEGDSSQCYAVTELTLQVNPLPNFNLEDNYTLCLNTNGTEVISPVVLDTELSEVDYSFEWSLNGTVIPTETSSSLTPTEGGTYSVTVTDETTSTETNCEHTVSTEVVESIRPTVEAEVITQAFANSHTITAEALPVGGNYEYSIDGGSWQDEAIFYNVSPGEHTITVRDKNGCGIGTDVITVIDYPLYFTPNGDSYHQTWNITDTDNELGNAKIYIFDRYGKLLKELSPTGNGWDGTYNGKPMPTSDYWFKIIYTESGQQKEFKANFTLKR